ncbi:hypothetical protein O1611_g1308 [Lasiodiplodia mahajangana]|uniref:Uncharacterized protein n=1 Tax=Lasiodiplodia mahajangana TaxID=1108764 RepID=A0ACC2JYP9_9PEZI|nr:hypothetical protein O1611_g1308 [Lasiodiplodia mahajangana]
MGWDDYLMLFALVLAFVATVVDFIAVNEGLGRHLLYLSYQQAVNQQFYSLLAQVFCVHALSFAKLSIIVSYIRVLRGSGSRFHEIVLWVSGISVFAVNTIVVITFYTACNPTEKSWNALIKGTCWDIQKKLAFFLLQGGKCLDTQILPTHHALGLLFSAYSAFTDFLLALYPFFLSKLQLKWRAKALVLGLMGLGTVTGAFAIIRTVKTGTQLQLPPTATPDVSFSTVLGLTWSGMERNIAILIGSVPALNPLATPMTKLLKSLGSSSSKLESAKSQSYQLSDGTRQPGLSSTLGKYGNEAQRSGRNNEKRNDGSEEHIMAATQREAVSSEV